MTRIKDVSPAEAFSMIKKGALLVDVREPGEVARKAFDVGDLMLIPLSKLQSRFSEIPANRKVVIACHSGNRSVVASRTLLSNGYTLVVNMQYGIAGWERAGLPVRKQPKKSPFAWLLKLLRKQE